MKEFAIIENYFQTEQYQRKDVVLGIGDDCAVTQVPDGQSLVVTTDTLISGVHFPPDTPPEAVAHKALAVNLSDLAAMGAEPAWFSLSLSLPDVDRAWLDAFSSSLHTLSDYYSVQLIGGDTVKGPLTITITAHGFVPHDQALTRCSAKPGDFVYVTGTLGDAGLGLDLVKGQQVAEPDCFAYLTQRLNYPTPRLLAGTTLRRIANACIDVSDGILSDIRHVLKRSGCGAVIHVDKLPLSEAMLQTVDLPTALNYALTSGDDYELLFTVSEEHRSTLNTALANFHVAATCIGQLNGKNGDLELKMNDEPFEINGKGFEHFSA